MEPCNEQKKTEASSGRYVMSFFFFIIINMMVRYGKFKRMRDGH